MLEDFEIIETIQENSSTNVYRAVSKADRSISFIIKVLATEYPDARDMARIRQEYELSKELDIEGIVKPIELRRNGNGYALILTDINGVSLQNIIRKGKFSSLKFLEIAIPLSKILGEIHLHGVIHKDIKPANIIVKDGRDVYITDFGLSTRLNREKARYSATAAMEGTLTYIAPEQTGRMNRSTDNRSDLYSLGVTFYEMLTGNPPFKSEDAIDLIHSHIAKVPPSPHEFDSSIENQLSNIVMKLISKAAEDRYQSALGLAADLERCFRSLGRDGKISEFQLGSDDSSGRLQIPQKLYGRSEEIETLLSAFERVSRGTSELLLVHGYSGVGKSALVHEVHKPITGKKGLFISGKFDQFQRDIPYYAIRFALKDLCEYLATESEEVLANWKTTILNALESNASVLIEIVPELELIIGKQPAVPELGTQESINRLNQVFQNFIRAISNREHPLVIFVDDLQWADSGSLNLIKILLTGAEEKHFLLIGAFRENEVDGTHAFSMTLDEIRKSGSSVQSIALNPLRKEDVRDLTMESLASTDRELITPLSELIYSKTGGNAFFVNEFLKNLYEEKLIYFDFSEKKWIWNIGSIEAKNVTSNVVDLMSQKIDRLPDETIRILQLGSCVGSQFSLKIISIIHEKNERDTLLDLWKSVEEGLILPLDNNYKIFQAESNEHKNDTDLQKSEVDVTIDVHFQFLHDKVQEAAYSGIGEDQKRKVHLTIGRLLFDRTESIQLPERIFSIVNQFNLGSELILDESEKSKLCELNLFAGKKAKHSSAHNSAIAFFKQGISLLDETHWKHQYDLSFELYSEKAACEYSAALLEDCEQDVKIALENAIGQDHKTAIYQIYLNLLYQLNRHQDGIEVGISALKYLGVKIPKNVKKAHIAFLYLRFRMLLGRRKARDLVELPEITDKRVFNICAIIYDLVPSAYQIFPDLMGYISLLMAMHCLKYGNSIYSGFAYAMTAVIMAGVTKELEGGFKFAELAETLSEKFYNIGVKAKVHFAIGNFNIHWVLPMREHKWYVDTALKTALEAGTINWADYSMTFSRIQGIFFTDKNLESILEENEKIYEMYLKHKDREVILNHYFILNFLNDLMVRDNNAPDPFSFDEDDYEREMETPGNFTIRTYFHTLKMIQNFMHENWESALSHGWKGFRIVLEVLGNMLDFQLRYYFVLSCLSYQISTKKSMSVKFRLAYKLNRFLLRYYSKKNPANFLAHDLLVSALEAQLEGNLNKAGVYFEKAIKESHHARFTINEALANECTAKFYIENDIEKAATAYMTEAVYLYSSWGATAKVKQLEENYGHYIRKSNSPKSMESISLRETHSSTGNNRSNTLDLTTILKASQAVSGEIRLEKLLSELMQNLIQNTGAEKGLLILEENRNWVIRAEGSANGTIDVLSSELLQQSKKLPRTIINYVLRSKQPLVLSRAWLDIQFQNDDYIIEVKPQSVLCAPIINQGKLSGAVYLENRLTADAFTPDRLQVVNILSSQAAISLENSLLYENLEEKVRERTEELSRLLLEIQELKHQQDADYFLTSLLLEPLGENKTGGENVKIEFFLRQKKHFTYKNKEYSIGGDLCGAHNIYLKNRKYTVFMNADAMGKSIQGAAGALITGSVFESIIQRTKLSEYWQNFLPEQWIRNSFTELQKVFENLEGTMLISILIGAVDELTGTVYTINSDYPAPILFRNGKAQHLPPSNFFLKLGVNPFIINESSKSNSQKIANYLSVDVFSLRDGDLLITGSDGKDDINLHSDRDGFLDKNQDENMILSLIEESNGDLEKLYELIQGKGELTDDLSLMRLSFHKLKKRKTAVTQNILQTLDLFRQKKIANDLEGAIAELKKSYRLGYKHPSLLKAMARSYYKLKKFRAASLFAHRYFLLEPADSSNLFLLSLSLFQIGRISQALETAESLVLRKREHAGYLVHYANILATTGDKTAESFLRRAELSDPNFPSISKLRKKINEKVNLAKHTRYDIRSSMGAGAR
ncbi:AAA ATPase domain protein [Leptospira broomii serovar Hurstbridge str. 5399]|uniref:AAA ATPase domain protein n=1 Tax=Leptospira broomii serovar Hurstbridge str. 5399 TaxID=1049789 RepID=T0F7V8_9LEPT|nr:trifunctional serine/threonine-protein kinase/ATP-binding protein/SpoIIE family protein phosphatase [Leptospira broomii]EQA43572.1 AAA ATPase domain protein [Leptospira broomii serovar Hurstbridge str. 5399]